MKRAKRCETAAIRLRRRAPSGAARPRLRARPSPN